MNSFIHYVSCIRDTCVGNTSEDNPDLCSNGICGPMVQDTQAPLEIGWGMMDVGSPRALETLPTCCRWDLQSTKQRSLEGNGSDTGGPLSALAPMGWAAMLSLDVKRWRKPRRLPWQPLPARGPACRDCNLHPCCYQRRKTNTGTGRKSHFLCRWWGCGFAREGGPSSKSGSGAPPAGSKIVLQLAEQGLNQVGWWPQSWSKE